MSTNGAALGSPMLTSRGSGTPSSWPVPEGPISVMIVDGQALFRLGLARLLGDDERLLVIGASEGDADLPATCASMSVDVVVTDLEPPRISGMELTRQIAFASPDTRVLILASDVDWRVIPAMAAGAAGFLLKDSDPEAIKSAVIAVHLGEKVLCREAAEWLIAEAPPHRLTRREMDVLRMVAEGVSNSEIARRLELQEKTVRNYVSRLYRKLASQSRSQIASYAAEAGFAVRDQKTETGGFAAARTRDEARP